MATAAAPLFAKDMGRYGRRRRSSIVMMSLCLGATVLGLAVLALILGTLVFKGVSGLSLSVFTQSTPPPGSSEGGLFNAILGSILMTGVGVIIGTPIGILAGTYMAEYGRTSRLSSVVRFINDILLSAPSIVMGLFVYAAMVKPMGHFSAIAGALSLAVIVIPIVVRTTENMLLLVPDQLREASSALGLPRSLVVRHVTYKAAWAGILTGILLAVARISGETAPLMFTALNNQFISWTKICIPWLGCVPGVEVPNPNAPMASLPAVIFQFALSPYADWQRLAWTGALLITVAVLSLSVLARWFGSSKSSE